MKRVIGILVASVALAMLVDSERSVTAQGTPGAKAAPDAKNLRVVGQNNLNGKGNGGEGLDLVQYPDGRRVLFYAHTAAPTCFTTIDVTNPAQPKVLAQLPTVAPFVRCNSLGVSGTTMIVAQNTDEPGQPNGGARIYAADRLGGGIYVLQYTGPTPLK